MITTFPAPPEPGNVYHADCFTLLDALEPESVNAIITDMPYGVTNCTWDTVVDLPRWWQSVKRVLKPRGVMVTTASQPFTSALVMSNPAWFKYEWIWEKTMATGFLNTPHMPLRAHENILIFSENGATFNPVMSTGTPYQARTGTKPRDTIRDKNIAGVLRQNSGTRHPRTILKFSNEIGLHPTQKPVPLYEYLTITYTLPGGLIVDPFCGSGTSLLAARNLNRRFIGGDITERYVELARRRLDQAYTVNMFEQTGITS